VLWDVLKNKDLNDADKKATVLDFDKVLGLGFENIKEEEIPAEVKILVKEREKARENKDWDTADNIREEIEEKGYDTDDTTSGTRIYRRR